MKRLLNCKVRMLPLNLPMIKMNGDIYGAMLVSLLKRSICYEFYGSAATRILFFFENATRILEMDLEKQMFYEN